MKNKKILIIGESFHSFSGGGITISNLFFGYPISNLAILATPKTVAKNQMPLENRVYQLGYDEYKMIFPFSFFQKGYKSGIPEAGNQISKAGKNKSSLKLLIEKTFLTVTNYLGIYPFLDRIRVTEQLIRWIKEFNPDYIYSQLSNRELIKFVGDLNVQLKIPIVIHIMDDWPLTLNKKGILKNYWDKKIYKELKNLLDKATYRFAISKAMAEEYSIRYSGEWKVFHNCIDINIWSKEHKIDYKLKQNILKVLYTGRIGIANSDQIQIMAKYFSTAIEKDRLEFHIYTPNFDSPTAIRLKDFKNTFVHKPVEYKEIPGLLKLYDLLYLPLDFSYEGRKFSKFSMPTKIIEYMISSVPILVHSPEDSAVFRYAKELDFAYLLPSNDFDDVEKLLHKILNDENGRRSYGQKGFYLASTKHNRDVVSNEFQKLF